MSAPMMSRHVLPSPYWRLSVVIVVLLAVVGCGGKATEGNPQSEPIAPNLPQQTLLSSSMREQPVPGWTVTVGDLGLAPGTVVRPVGNIDDLGVFLGITDEGWLLLGLDVSSGKRMFGPVRLGPADGATDFNCFVNGPPKVLCVRQNSGPNLPSTAWVVDTTSGELVFDGPTDLRVAGPQGQPNLEQFADYAIATVANKGVYGVGPHGELTWFVPGDGNLTSQFTVRHLDSIPSVLAVQGTGKVADLVFSVADGKVVKPVMPDGVQLGRAVVYPGGFGYEYTTAGDYTAERVAFFDSGGNKLGEPATTGTLETRSLDVPIVGSKARDLVLTVEGQQLLELPPSVPSPYARLIGSRFFVASDADHRVWEQFDLRTGEAGKTCHGESLWTYYIGSDGEVAVARDEGNGLVAGVDLTTCDVLWSIPGPASHEAKEVWKVNTTLVQRTNDRLFSLVSPR